MIGVAVGTFLNGFDDLVAAADEAVGDLKLDGYAQIGESSIEPTNLDWFRFAPSTELHARFLQTTVLVCHAGMGLIGDGIRCGCRIVLFPRTGATTRKNPANDQTEFAKAIAKRYELSICLSPSGLAGCLRHEIDLAAAARPTSKPTSNVPALVAEFLARG